MKKSTLLLSISLLLNVFFVGYFAGNGFFNQKHYRHDKKHDFHHVSKELRNELKTKRQELFEIMSAKDFIEKDFDSKILEIQAIHQKVKAGMPEKLKNKMLGKSQEERINFVKKIKHRHRHKM